MITILMNKKGGLNRFSKLPDDGDHWVQNNSLYPKQKEKKKTPVEARWAKQQTRSSSPNQLK